MRAWCTANCAFESMKTNITLFSLFTVIAGCTSSGITQVSVGEPQAGYPNGDGCELRFRVENVKADTNGRT